MPDDIIVSYFDKFNCTKCGKDSSESSGGVLPNAIDAYCKDCWEVRTQYETCVECGLKFDMHDTQDAVEWFFGHDCVKL
tara:strand:- start:20488 stop:20724 length:237 start_codon:yes stop_codon:yes gene_type:complete